jgi:phenylpropionate dioxygenase-like ring-hydroxylating dioxygenase large terminal subunit
MNGFLSDQDVAARVLSHVEEGTTDRRDEVWREPVDHYRSEERLAAEREVLRRSATVFCPSAALPDVGSYLAREVAGVPLLVVRGRDRRLRAFRNACRHRGTQVASGAGCVKAFVCPYHGWAYKLDGTLQHVPHENGFPGLDKGAHGLSPVAVEEHCGLVWVSQDCAALEAAPWRDLPELISPEQRILKPRDAELPVNWKIFLEGFIEGYHIKYAHMESFYPYGYDNLNVVEHVGPHTRITYPFRRIEKLRVMPPAERRVDGLLTYVYQLFPNAFITVLSRHTNLIVLEPEAPDRTHTWTWPLTNPGDDADGSLAQRDASFVNDTGAIEDFFVVASIQKSLGSGASEYFTFGHFEGAITHFHRSLGEALAAADHGTNRRSRIARRTTIGGGRGRLALSDRPTIPRE